MAGWGGGGLKRVQDGEIRLRGLSLEGPPGQIGQPEEAAGRPGLVLTGEVGRAAPQEAGDWGRGGSYEGEVARGMPGKEGGFPPHYWGGSSF